MNLPPTRARLVAIDVDGTLLNGAHLVTATTREALRRARAAGVDIVLATSRGPGALADVLRQLSLPGAAVGQIDVIASQGAVRGRWTGERLEIDQRSPIPLDVGHQIVSLGRRAGLAVSWYSGPDWYVSDLDPTIEREASVVRARPIVMDLQACHQAPDKMMMIDPKPASPALAGIRSGLPAGVVAQVSNPSYLEITRLGVDKGEALAAVCGDRGIPPHEVVAMGDGPNDLGMLRFAGTSVAPANAHADVLAMVSFVTRSNDHDGVAHALDVLLA